MKKNNIIIFTLLALLSAFFLWLWYYLGLNAIDEPLDLVLSFVWWIVIVVAVLVVAKMERTRRCRVRTVYVGEGAVFNSEKGLIPLDDTISAKEAIASILDSLKYGFTRKDFPDRQDFEAKYFVRTEKYELLSKKGEAVASETKMVPASTDLPDGRRLEVKTWEGAVCGAQVQEKRAFDTPEKLASILVSLERITL
ncbi:MAG: hypothetical protein RR723_04675 [Raoultibacter sp.]